MIERVTLRSVKSFLSEVTIPMAPVTLITGTNSSGKSTIFQTLLLIKQAFEHPALSLDGMHLNGPQASVGSYNDWCSKHDHENVSVAIAISNSALLSAPGARGVLVSRRQRRAITPILWWQDRGPFGRRFRSDARVSGTLRMTFSPSDDSPNDARLKSVSWSATFERGEDRSRYDLTVIPASPTIEELDAAEMDSENDAETYRYSMLVERAWSGDSAGPVRKPQNFGPAYCAVEGLLPTNVLRATGAPAAAMTVAGQLATVLAWARGSYRTPSDAKAPAVVARFPKAVAEALMSPTRRRFEVLAGLALRADAAQAASMLGAVGEMRLAAAIVAEFVSPWKPDAANDPEIRSAAREAIAAVLTMALRLIAIRGKAAEGDTMPNLEHFEASAKRIAERYPVLEAPVTFLGTTAQLSADPGLRAGIVSAVEMADKHAASDREQLQPTPLEIALRAPNLEEGAPPPGAPSADAIRRYIVEGLFHLGPLRDEPRVLYVADVPLAPHDVGKRGQRAISCLREFGADAIEFPMPQTSSDDRTELTIERTQLSEVVSRWGQYLGIFDGLQIDTSEKYGTIVKVKGVIDGKSISPDLTNVGVGVSQVLPILVLCVAMPVGGCALIEQPELHLHPSVQSRLAVFFAACAKSGRQVVLESHSEHLVNRTRLIVALGELPAENVSVVFVERDEYGATATPIKLLPDGSIERWPRGFLDEAERVLAALMRARSNPSAQ